MSSHNRELDTGLVPSPYMTTKLEILCQEPYFQPLDYRHFRTVCIQKRGILETRHLIPQHSACRHIHEHDAWWWTQADDGGLAEQGSKSWSLGLLKQQNLQGKVPE